jgi:hypothetical protein
MQDQKRLCRQHMADLADADYRVFRFSGHDGSLNPRARRLAAEFMKGGE